MVFVVRYVVIRFFHIDIAVKGMVSYSRFRVFAN